MSLPNEHLENTVRKDYLFLKIDLLAATITHISYQLLKTDNLVHSENIVLDSEEHISN